MKGFIAKTIADASIQTGKSDILKKIELRSRMKNVNI